MGGKLGTIDGRDRQEQPGTVEIAGSSELPNAQASGQHCPQCQAVIPVSFGYVPWCDQCGWNVKPHDAVPPENVLQSMYARLGKRYSRGLFDQLQAAQSLKPAWSTSRVLAVVMAITVHGLTLAVAALGVALLIKGWPYLVAIIGGGLCLALAWALRPRPPQVEGEIAPRDRFPELYRLSDDVTRALGASKLDGIVLDGQFNAGYAEAGWRRKRILRLGLPLLAILDGQECVALLAHELAHGVNGDPARGLFIGSAVGSLATWYEFLHPDEIWPRGRGLVALAMIPANLLMLALSGLPWLGAYVLSHLLWRDSQRAEYLADALAARVSGCDAMLGMLDKLHLERVFVFVAQRAAAGRGSADFFLELRRQVAEVPGREMERIRRVEQMEASRLDITHPPTTYRIALLQRQVAAEPQVRLPAERWERVEAEIAAAEAKIAERIVDRQRARLYSEFW